MELLDLYNNKKEKIGKVFDRNSSEPKDGEFKLSVHTWIVNSKNEFLIQKRSDNIKRHPGKWAFTGGAVDAGESSLEGAMREVNEELGIEVLPENMEYLISFKREKGFVDVWLLKSDINEDDLKLQKEEVDMVKWVSLDELEDIISSGNFVPSVNLYYELFTRLLKKCHNF